MKKSLKKWTILIYADGNNEMESIMYNSLLACEKIVSNNDINIVFEIGRLGKYKSENGDNWSGVRRYYVDRGNLTLVEDLGKSNMADPNNLYSFMKWGFENYKSEHYMLVLSDHGGDFIGCFTDESADKPYIMGIPEMIQAINALKINLGYEIDILVLDMCYMNSIEVMYELGQNNNNTVKNVITYMDYAAYDGISYEKLVSLTERYCYINNLNLFIENLIDGLDFDLMAFEVNHDKLKAIKELFDTAAHLYHLEGNTENLFESLNKNTNYCEGDSFIKNINNLLNSMIVKSKSPFDGLSTSVKVTSKDIGQLIAFYKKLAFSKNNFWTEFLSSFPIHKQNRDTSKINVALTSSSSPLVHHIIKFYS
ncbi:hypothetical protein HMPREF1982_03864 [Clostridiales bacterium oral taxon 876 str. F0540]|nr:hypothetical protein HMPREF1982_03864 [Clostridiales bacterium oral taxon 876 str. F0540]